MRPPCLRCRRERREGLATHPNGYWRRRLSGQNCNQECYEAKSAMPNAFPSEQGRGFLRQEADTSTLSQQPSHFMLLFFNKCGETISTLTELWRAKAHRR